MLTGFSCFRTGYNTNKMDCCSLVIKYALLVANLLFALGKLRIFFIG